MWHVNVITDQKSAIRANFYPFLPKPPRARRTYWHMRYVRMTGGRMRYVLMHSYSYLRLRLRKARGYYAHAARRMRAGLAQKPVRPYVRCSLLTDMLL